MRYLKPGRIKDANICFYKPIPYVHPIYYREGMFVPSSNNLIHNLQQGFHPDLAM